MTMTVFYLFFYAALFIKHGGNDISSVTGSKLTVFLILVALAIVRISLCTFPQNHWFTRDKETKWGLYRNIPFVIMGVITVLYFTELSGT